MVKFKNILIIDDDVINNMFTSDELIRSQLVENVEIAYDGQEGLNKLKEFTLHNTNFPELILVDVNMPIMDGFEFLEKLNELDLHPKPKVVMLSSSLHPKDINRSIILGALGYLEKPFTTKKLILALNKDH